MKINRIPDEEDFADLLEELKTEFAGQELPESYFMSVMRSRAAHTGRTIKELLAEDLKFLRELRTDPDEAMAEMEKFLGKNPSK